MELAKAHLEAVAKAISKKKKKAIFPEILLLPGAHTWAFTALPFTPTHRTTLRFGFLAHKMGIVISSQAILRIK